jgi:hypothetical protein
VEDVVKFLEKEIESEERYIGSEYYHGIYIGGAATERIAHRQVMLCKRIIEMLENQKSANK